MIINPVTITMSKHEAERVWGVVDKRITALARTTPNAGVWSRLLMPSGPPSPPQPPQPPSGRQSSATWEPRSA